MKKYSIFLFVMLVVSQIVWAQEKAETVKGVDSPVASDNNSAPKVKPTAPTDSIVANTPAKKIAPESVTTPVSVSAHRDSLAMVNDSLKLELDKFRVLYTAIKEKVIMHDFDPLRMALIIDSLALRRDSTFSGIKSSSPYLKDSIIVLNREIRKLKEQIKGLTTDDSLMSKMISDLKMLKELLDSNILTQSEFDIRKTQILGKYK